jgi:hypothetical protein
MLTADTKHATTFYQACNTDSKVNFLNGPEDNRTSDVSFPIHESTKRNNVSQLELRSLEVPDVQYLLEPAWNRLYFEKTPQIQTDANQLIFQTSDGTNHVVSIAPTYNPIVSVQQTSSGEFIFETKMEHCIDLDQKTAYSYEVSLIGTGSEHPRVHLSSTNVESATKVRAAVTAVVSGDAKSGPLFGNLWHEPAATMKDFTDYLGKRIRQKLPNIEAEYTVGCIRFKLKAGGAGGQKVYLVPTPLSKLLGFDQKTVAVPVACSDSPPWLSYGLLEPGNSPLRSLTSAMQFSVSQAFFPSSLVIYMGSQFASGRQQVLVVGRYSISTLCEHLSVEGKVTVEFSERDRKFRFTSGDPFSIDFEDFGVELRKLMGFGNTATWKQSLQFVSGSPVYDVPIFSCPPILWEYDAEHKKKLTMRIQPHTQVQMKVEEIAGSDASSLVTLRMEQHTGHGFSKGLLLRVTKTSSSQQHDIYLPVEAVTGYDSVTVHTGGSGLAVGDNVHVAPALKTRPSLVIDRERHACIPPYLFGFKDKTVFSGGDTPHQVSYEGFPYTLVELVHPDSQQTNLEHTGEAGCRNVIAKVQLGPHPATGISFQTVIAKFTNARSIPSVRLRLLNPDYSLHNLHNKPWSCTIKFN